MPYTLDELYTDEELAPLTLTQLKEIATEWGIDLAGATLKADVFAVVSAFFAAERAKVPVSSLLESPSFRPIDKDGKDIKSQFKVEQVSWNAGYRKTGTRINSHGVGVDVLEPVTKTQRSIVPPDGWGGGSSNVE
jgi:hypothetical protein